MAAYQKRGDSWRALVRRKGLKPVTKTFARKADAVVWARKLESEVDEGFLPNIGESSRVTISELLDRYAAATAGVKRSAPKDKSTINLIKKHFGHLTLNRLGARHITAFKDERLKAGRSLATIKNNIHLLSAMLEMARTQWDYYLPENPVRKVKLETPDNQRTRRLSKDEEERLLAATAKYSHPVELRSIIIVAVETGMRLGELLDLTWDRVDLKKGVAFLPTSKTKDSRYVPLSKRALDAIEKLPKDGKDNRLFDIWSGSDTFNKTWRKTLERAGIADLRFHDLRHEAASRFNEMGMSTVNIAAITGHKSFQMVRRYSHPPAEFLAKLIDKLKDDTDQDGDDEQ